MVYFSAKCNIIVLDNKKTKGRIDMRKTTEALVKKIIKENEKELVRDLNKSTSAWVETVGVQPKLHGFTVVIKIDNPESWYIRDYKIIEVYTYKTYQSAKKLANEVYKMILTELEDQLGYYEKY